MFKSRTLASTAIKAGKVKMKKETVKPSKIVCLKDVYDIKITSDDVRIIEVVELIEKRASYEKIKHCYIDHSPPKETKEMHENVFFKTPVSSKKGSGRPTKKNRRDLGKQGGWF